jgi:hypothetical protein
VRLTGEVAQTATDEPERLTRAVFGLDRIRVERCQSKKQPILEAAETEESSSSPRRTRPACDATEASRLEQLVVGVVHLATDAVLAAVCAEFDVVVVTTLEQPSTAPVAAVGRADEVVVGDVVEPPQARASGRDLVGEPAGATCPPPRQRWIFRPCSSVPVRNPTSWPISRCHRRAPPTIVV